MIIEFIEFTNQEVKKEGRQMNFIFGGGGGGGDGRVV